MTETPHDITRTVHQIPFMETFLTSDAVGWRKIRVFAYRLLPHDTPVTGFHRHDTLILHLDKIAELERRLNGKTRTTTSAPGGLWLAPKDDTVRFRWTGSPVRAAFEIDNRLRNALIEELSKTDPIHVELVENFNFRDRYIEQIGRSLLRELQSPQLGGQLYADHLALLLEVHLLEHYSNRAIKPPTPLQTLTSAQLHRVQDYIHAHLNRDVGLIDIAAHIGLTRWHFTRLFKNTLGLPLHQYVLTCRLECAKEMLLTRRYTLEQIAAKVGFTDSGHMSKMFKRAFGITPSDFQKGDEIWRQS